MKNLISFFCIGAIMILLSNCSSIGGGNAMDQTAKIEYKLVWSDEFNYEGALDSTKWVYDIGDACDKPAGCGWGNNEKQYYTNSEKNVRVSDSLLQITLRNEPIANSLYSSARVKTKGKGDWKYGRFVTRAKLPKGLGVWPAIWMLPTNTKYGGWPKCGEIDIMENVGYAPDSIVSTAHTGTFNHMLGTHKNGEISVPDNGEVFHDYILEWNEHQYSCYVDDNLVFTYKNDGSGFMSWPFDQKFHLIINLAFGGNWAGKHGVDPEILPATLLIDYVRVYQL